MRSGSGQSVRESLLIIRLNRSLYERLVSTVVYVYAKVKNRLCLSSSLPVRWPVHPPPQPAGNRSAKHSQLRRRDQLLGRHQGGWRECIYCVFAVRCLPLPLGVARNKSLRYVAANLHQKVGKCNRWRTFSLRSTAADGYFCCCCFCSNKWSALIEHFLAPSWFPIALNNTSFSPTHAHTNVWPLPWTNDIIKKKKKKL